MNVYQHREIACSANKELTEERSAQEQRSLYSIETSYQPQ